MQKQKNNTQPMPEKLEQEFTKGQVNSNLHDGNVYCSAGMVLANCYTPLRSPATIKANAAHLAECWNEYPKALKALDELLKAMQGLRYGTQEETDTVLAAKDLARDVLRTANK